MVSSGGVVRQCYIHTTTDQTKSKTHRFGVVTERRHLAMPLWFSKNGGTQHADTAFSDRFKEHRRRRAKTQRRQRSNNTAKKLRKQGKLNIPKNSYGRGWQIHKPKKKREVFHLRRANPNLARDMGYLGTHGRFKIQDGRDPGSLRFRSLPTGGGDMGAKTFRFDLGASGHLAEKCCC